MDTKEDESDQGWENLVAQRQDETFAQDFLTYVGDGRAALPRGQIAEREPIPLRAEG